MKQKFKDIVIGTFSFLVDDYGYNYESEDDSTHKFIGPHLSVEIYYSKWELDVILYRRIYTSILRPNKTGSFDLGWLLHHINPNELDDLRAIGMNNTEQPSNEKLENSLRFYARKLEEHFPMALKDDLKFLEQLSLKVASDKRKYDSDFISKNSS